jgi:hypothetical protein
MSVSFVQIWTKASLRAVSMGMLCRHSLDVVVLTTSADVVDLVDKSVMNIVMSSILVVVATAERMPKSSAKSNRIPMTRFRSKNVAAI